MLPNLSEGKICSVNVNMHFQCEEYSDHFNNILKSKPRSSQQSPSFWFNNRMSVHFSSVLSLQHAAPSNPLNLIVCASIALIMLGKQYTIKEPTVEFNSTPCCNLQYKSKYYDCILFRNTLSIFLSIKFLYEFSYLYETRDTFVIFFIHSYCSPVRCTLQFSWLRQWATSRQVAVSIPEM